MGRGRPLPSLPWGHTVTHPYTGSPVFAAPDAGDYHIGFASAARDRGVDAGVTVDLDGEPRLGIPDLGADEYLWRVYLPLVLRQYP